MSGSSSCSLRGAPQVIASSTLRCEVASMGKQDWDAAEARWAKQIEAVVGGMRAWRVAHPRATFREIAAAIDAELNPLRAQLLAETAAASPQARFTELPIGERPRCARCGG